MGAGSLWGSLSHTLQKQMWDFGEVARSLRTAVAGILGMKSQTPGILKRALGRGVVVGGGVECSPEASLLQYGIGSWNTAEVLDLRIADVCSLLGLGMPVAKTWGVDC